MGLYGLNIGGVLFEDSSMPLECLRIERLKIQGKSIIVSYVKCTSQCGGMFPLIGELC